MRSTLSLTRGLMLCIRYHKCLCSLPTDFEGGREDLHDLLCVGNLCGFILLGESDLGCGGHGL